MTLIYIRGCLWCDVASLCNVSVAQKRGLQTTMRLRGDLQNWIKRFGVIRKTTRDWPEWQATADRTHLETKMHLLILRLFTHTHSPQFHFLLSSFKKHVTQSFSSFTHCFQLSIRQSDSTHLRSQQMNKEKKHRMNCFIVFFLQLITICT